MGYRTFWWYSLGIVNDTSVKFKKSKKIIHLSKKYKKKKKRKHPIIFIFFYSNPRRAVDVIRKHYEDGDLPSKCGIYTNIWCDIVPMIIVGFCYVSVTDDKSSASWFLIVTGCVRVVIAWRRVCQHNAKS